MSAGRTAPKQSRLGDALQQTEPRTQVSGFLTHLHATFENAAEWQ